MKRLFAILTAAALASVGPVASGADIGATMAKVYAKAVGGLAIIEFDIKTELGESKAVETGICIMKNGTLMTTTLDARTRPETIKAIRIILPGVERKTLKAKLLGIDQVTGLTFVQAPEPHKWSVIGFAKAAKVAPGMAVFSVGLMGPDLAFKPFVGAGYVSAMVRTPAPLVYITGGSLTRMGSPVFRSDGVAIGLVQRQLLLGHRMMLNRRLASVRLSGQERTFFFVPVEEFVAGLENIPSGGKVRRVPWLGVLSFEPLPASVARTLRVDSPAVMVGKVAEGTSAAKAGLKDGDIIIAVNGRPLENFPKPNMVAQQFVRDLVRMRVGTKVSLTIASAMKKRVVEVELVSWPMRPEEAKRYYNRKLGMLLRNKVAMDRYLEETVAGKMEGVYALMVGRDSPAAKAGLRARDLIVSIGGTPVKNVDEAGKLISDSLTKTPAKGITLTVKRGEQTEPITIRPPR